MTEAGSLLDFSSVKEYVTRLLALVGATGGVHLSSEPFSVSKVKGIKSIIWLFNGTGVAESADIDFLLTFIKVTGIVSLYISLQLSQMWSLAHWQAASPSNKYDLGVICIQLTRLFTTIKCELGLCIFVALTPLFTSLKVGL